MLVVMVVAVVVLVVLVLAISIFIRLKNWRREHKKVIQPAPRGKLK